MLAYLDPQVILISFAYLVSTLWDHGVKHPDEGYSGKGIPTFCGEEWAMLSPHQTLEIGKSTLSSPRRWGVATTNNER